jgi:hypothetical protein
MIADPIEQISAKLPNGLHDAQISSISLDYVGRRIRLELDVWLGDLDSAVESDRERYQAGILIISGFDFCVIQAPDFNYPFAKKVSVRIDSGSGNPQNVMLFQNVPEDTFAHWFFVNEWNSFIYFVARDANYQNVETCQLSWGRTVIVSDTAPGEFRPGELGSICGFRDPKEQSEEIEHNAVALKLCLVEFGDGEAIEIPATYLSVS